MIVLKLCRRRRKLLKQDTDLNMDIVLVQEGSTVAGGGIGECKTKLARGLDFDAIIM